MNEVFSLNKQYIVPRFQREFSWDLEQIRDFWEDVIAAITIEPKKKLPTCSEYFIGPLVLIGDDSASHFSIVDGQQRLTTITILLRALVNALAETGDIPAADAVYSNYVEGKDNDGKSYFKLKNETPKPYFQNEIQFRTPQKIQTPQTDEEKALAAAFDFFRAALSPTSLNTQFPGVAGNSALKAIRDQTLNFLRVVNISVADEDDAYSIFETLNARGLNLRRQT